MSTRRTQAQRSESTQQLLIDTGRRLFAEHGYTGTSTEQVVREAGVTRGALYHHYSGKRALFEAVFEQLEREIYEGVLDAIAAAGPTEEPWRVGVDAFLDGCMDPAAQRIVLLDAPSVLGWGRWREIDGDYFRGLIVTMLEQGMATGEFARQPAQPVAQMLLGALSEAAMAIAEASDMQTAREQFGAAAAALIGGLRVGGARTGLGQ